MEHSLSARDIAVFLFKWKRLILAVIGTTLIVTTLLVYALPPGYTAVARVMVERAKSPSLRTEIEIAPSGPEVLNTEIAMATSRTVMSRVVDELRLPDRTARTGFRARMAGAIRGALESSGLIYPVDPRERWIISLGKQVKVKPVLDANVFTIKYSADDPKLAAEVVNGVSTKYIELHAEVFSANPAAAFFQRTVEQAKEKLDGYQAEVDRYKSEGLLAAAPSRMQGLVEEKRDLETRLRSNRLQLDDLLTRFEPQHSRVTSMRAAIRTLEAQSAQIDRQLQDLGSGDSEVEEMMRPIRLQEETFRTYKAQLDQVMLNAQAGLNMVNVQVIDPAAIPARPSFPRLFFLMAALVGGAVLAVAVALLREYFDHRVDTPREARALLGIEVLGSVRYAREGL